MNDYENRRTPTTATPSPTYYGCKTCITFTLLLVAPGRAEGEKGRVKNVEILGTGV